MSSDPNSGANTPRQNSEPTAEASKVADARASLSAGLANIPSVVPIGPTPQWAMIVGSIFGAITLLGLFLFAYLAANNQSFICNSFALLAAIFALGSALSASFIGGAAAASGQLGTAAQNNVLRYSLGGGVSVLVIVFLVFQVLKPNNCVHSVTLLDFDNVPLEAHFLAGKDFWYRWAYESPRTNEYTLRLEGQQNGRVDITLENMNGNGSYDCSIAVHHLDEFEQIKTRYRELKFDIKPILQGEDEFRLNFRPPQPSNGIKAVSPECLFNEGKPIQTFIAISSRYNQLMYGIPEPALQVGNLSWPFLDEAYSSVSDVARPASMIIGPASAQSAPPSYADLKIRLTSSNDITRVQARRYLEANFKQYSEDVQRELFQVQQENGDYLASLISGVISGIEAAANPPGSLTPGLRRDLSTTLPYVTGHEHRLIELNGHPSDAVKQQARRLVSRFPFDQFKDYYDQILTKASQSCKLDGFDGDPNGVIYSGIFYYYNRIIQLNYDLPSLPDQIVTQVDQIGKMVHDAAANCLPLDLATDAALIDFGRAIVYSEDSGGKHLRNAKAAARQFLNFLNGKEDMYFLQSHISAMKKLAS